MEQEKNLKSFGDRVKDCRIAAHLSQEYVAEVMGYKTRSSIQKIEAGKADIPKMKIYQLAHVLKTTPAYLLGLTDNSADFETLQEQFIDAPLPIGNDGKVDKVQLHKDYLNLMLADPKVFQLLQDLMNMTLSHREVLYELARTYAEADRPVLDEVTD